MPPSRLMVTVPILLLLAQVSPSASRPQAPAAALLQLADEVSKDVERLRGWMFKAPIAKSRTTPDEVRKYLERRVAESLPAGRLQLHEVFLKTLGLVPPDVDLKSTLLTVLQSQVGGYYDPEAKALFLVDRPSGVPSLAERLIMAHELTHALDDQNVNLRQFLDPSARKSEDMDLVTAALAEGSATGLMIQYLAQQQMAGKVNMAELMEYARRESELSKPLLEAPRYFSVMLASYVCGAQFLARGSLASLALAPDNKAFGDAFRIAISNLPQSTEQVLHPAKYWDPPSRDDPIVVDDAAVERWLTKPGRWIVHRDTVGEMLTAILTMPPAPLDLMKVQLPDAWTSPAAAGWGGDRFYLLARGETAVEAARLPRDTMGVWITFWDTTADRDEFLSGLKVGPMPAGNASSPLGPQEAVVWLGVDDTERTALLASLAKSPLPVTRGGKPWPTGT